MAQLLIYALLDPRTGAARYIGKSSSGLRPQSHALVSNLKRDKSHKATWIRALQRDGLSYGVLVLETVIHREQLDEAECRWIAAARVVGWPVTNHTDGGDGAGPRLDLTARNRSQAGKPGRQQLPSEIEKRRQLMTGNTYGRANRDRVYSAEALQRMSVSQRRRNGRPVTRINLLPRSL